MTGDRPRFLILRLSSIGDIVHALPPVVALARTYPQAAIDWVVETRFAVLLDANPFVRRVLRLDTLGWRRRVTSFATMREVRLAIRELRQFPYDAAIDFQGLIKSGIIAAASRSRRRIGFAHRRLREPLAGAFYTERASTQGRTHVIEENFALVERLGVRVPDRLQWEFPLPSPPEDERAIAGQLAATGAHEFFLINPGGGWTSKCWPPESYAALIRRLAKEFSAKLLVTGSPAEEPLARSILEQAATPQASFFPCTLVQFIALTRRARLFIGGDTGPLHLAAATRTPIVAIFGPTDPARNGPFAPDDITLSNLGPINHRRTVPGFLPGIEVDMVLAAVRQRLSGAHE